ncbi:hypothetical protein V6N12_069591 [Hibiscus sabdariffa]|uniref:Uncharacterized protein n=1 Tax=Hibiscus sabdariffa TaxID=183260 RepID=A0ABR2FEE5_9ROSI
MKERIELKEIDVSRTQFSQSSVEQIIEEQLRLEILGVIVDVDDIEESVEPDDGEVWLSSKSLAGNSSAELVLPFGHLKYWKKGGHLTIKPIPSQNLPHVFDPSAYCSAYMRNIHSQVIKPLLQDAFASDDPIKIYKLISKEKSSYGFIHYLEALSWD